MPVITEKPTPECQRGILAVHDAMYILGGKWKISLVAALIFGPKRYSELLRSIPGISGKMLSRELKEMETNLLVRRKVSKNLSLNVTYELTDYGQSVQPIIEVLSEWGGAIRKSIASR